jgi:RNA polymerase sigma-70 factor (ECF subfamily)
MDIDPEIITKAINKDLIAFEQVVFTFEKPIFNYLFRLLGSRPDAEDAVQDTFIKVYKNLKTYQPEKKFSTWVFAAGCFLPGLGGGVLFGGLPGPRFG